MDPFSIFINFFAWLASSSAVLIINLLVACIAALLGSNFRAFFVGGLWGLILPIALFAYGNLVERNLCKVKKVDISSPNIPVSLDGYKVAQLSDFHLASFNHRSRALERIVSKTNDQNPDLIVFTGDLVTGMAEEISPLMEQLKQFKSQDGVFSVMGNHDYCTFHNTLDSAQIAQNEALVRELQGALGWNLLEDTAVNFPNGLSLLGVENISTSPVFPSKGDISKAMEKAEGDFKILLLHDPSVWTNQVLGKTDVDLTLSGHTHAAQMSFFGWSPGRVMYRENRGLYSSRNACYKDLRNPLMEQFLYVNGGLGETGLMTRVGVKPEITIFTLHHLDDNHQKEK